MAYKQHFKFCFCFKRMFRLREAEPPESMKIIFQQYSENDVMTVDHLHRFLIEVQEEQNASKDSAQAIFNSTHKLLKFLPRKGLTLDIFIRYLLTDDQNGPLRPLGVHHDMSAPLAHYFLYTSHNSYLTGNQLSSDSSTGPIVDALKRGVRVIELDLWPNSKKNDVEVRHGGTLTRPVDLIKCLHAIKENAFSASEYPVVITFEDHLKQTLQAKVAKMVTKTFGEMLYRNDAENLEVFPSPGSLKRKILISTKPPKEYLDEESSMEIEDSQKQGSSDEEQTQNTYKKKLGATDKVLLDEDEDQIFPEYRSLIAIHAGKPKGGIDDCLIDTNTVRRLSLSEQELENAVKTHGAAIIRFTQRNLLRVYPKGMRLDSSNYDPMLGWTHGAQMVALNMQVAIAGVPADEDRKQTRAIEDEWLPVWDQSFEFSLRVPELAVLRIEALEYDTTGVPDFGGQTCLPISELRNGIRVVPLNDKKGNQYKHVRLLMRFEMRSA
ncbi:phosphoinositide phospholipase C 2-like isoform X2 [Quercus robur]|uniref:phosphoinositide phospholipase C 2-like isoform X2 n=1 Tax=Quercus robur TaxID=38942 RepID=UPI0021615149|nr:phosphoinositide phospholipase C 2-like isoform X2 [Quercus robur]